MASRVAVCSSDTLYYLINNRSRCLKRDIPTVFHQKLFLRLSIDKELVYADRLVVYNAVAANWNCVAESVFPAYYIKGTGPFYAGIEHNNEVSAPVDIIFHCFA